MSKKGSSWRCSDHMGGVTCLRPFPDNTATRRRYHYRRFSTKAAYEASDLHPSRRKNDQPFPSAKAVSSRKAKFREHHLRLRTYLKVPTNILSTLNALPKDWRNKSDPFETSRVFANGSLPSFKAMGATGKGNFGGIVIYGDDTYQKYKN